MIACGRIDCARNFTGKRIKGYRDCNKSCARRKEVPFYIETALQLNSSKNYWWEEGLNLHE